MIEFQCTSWLMLYSWSKTSNYLLRGLKLPLNRSLYTIYQRSLLCSLALKPSMLDNSPVCLSKEFHIPKGLSQFQGLTRDQEIHFKQRYFKSGWAERRRKSAEWVLENSVSLNDVYVSKENENYFFTLFKSSLQASFFRRRVGIRAAFEVLLQIQDTDSDLPL